MTLHRLKLKDLDARFIQELKAAYANEEAEITLWLNPTMKSKSSEHLSEAEFWSLIDDLDWEKVGDNAAVIAPVVKRLSEFSVEAIQTFQDILAEKLYHLDGEKYATEIDKNAYQSDKYFSVDSFLYARCCVVANGKDFYESVLKSPNQMPKDLTFGALLRVAAEAFELKTGEKFKYIPTYIYETYANSSGWNNGIENDSIKRMVIN
jgi:hypothetical protein